MTAAESDTPVVAKDGSMPKFFVVHVMSTYYVVQKSTNPNGIYEQFADCGDMRNKAELIAEALNSRIPSA